MSAAIHPMLNIAIKAARQAGAVINRGALDLDILKVGRKGPNDFVSDVDRAAEAAIIETILQAYPDHGILAEESGREAGNAKSEFQLHWSLLPRCVLDPTGLRRRFFGEFAQRSNGNRDAGQTTCPAAGFRRCHPYVCNDCCTRSAVVQAGSRIKRRRWNSSQKEIEAPVVPALRLK